MKTFWDLFNAGQFTTTVTCTTCGTVSRTDEPFSELMLTFPQPHHESDQDCTVEDLIAHHCGTQDIDDYQCDCCNGRKQRKSLTLLSVPPILCIVLSHRKLNGGSIQLAVQFHVSGVNITEDDLQYNLLGTVHYRPRGPDHGHYTSICLSQRSQSRNWFNYNDLEVSISNFTSKKQSTRVLKGHTKMVTILFYVHWKSGSYSWFTR